MIKNLCIEKIYIIFAMLFGMLFIFATPPFQSVDEPTHFLRAYSISNGNFISEKVNANVGNYLPSSINSFSNKYNYIFKDISKKISVENLKNDFSQQKNSNQEFSIQNNTALYSPIPYIAQTSGIIISKIINAPPIIALYLARFCNLLLYTILGFFAIKTAPNLKLAIFLILMMPMNLSLGASCSTDATILGCSLIFFAIITNILYLKQINKKQIITLSILAIILALSKHNLFLLPLICLIPRNYFKGKYFLKIGAILIPAISLCLLWSAIIKGLYIPLNPQANMYAQLDNIIKNPINFLGVLIATTVIKSFRILITMIGVLGWQDTRLDNLTYIFYPILIGFATYFSINTNDSKSIKLSKLQQIVLSTILILSSVAIMTYMYLSWTPLNYWLILGLNGKYFAPLILPLLFLTTTFFQPKQTNLKIEITIYIITFCILLSSIFSILIRFFNIFPQLYYQI